MDRAELADDRPAMLYDLDDRVTQIQELLLALDELIRVVEDTDEVRLWGETYREARERAARLLVAGVSQESAIALGKSVPDMFYRHREWEPPFEALDDGTRREAAWYARVAPHLERVLAIAGRLRILGDY